MDRTFYYINLRKYQFKIKENIEKIKSYIIEDINHNIIKNVVYNYNISNFNIN